MYQQDDRSNEWRGQECHANCGCDTYSRASAPPPHPGPCEKQAGGGANAHRYAGLRKDPTADAVLPTNDHPRSLAPAAHAIPGQPSAPVVPVGERLDALT
jgi:hypothetical protein